MTADCDTDDELYRQVFLRSLDAIVIVDCNSGAIVCANPATERLLGWTSDTLRRQSFFMLLPESETLTAKELLECVVVHDGVFTQRFRGAGGHLCLLDMSATMLSARGRDLIAITLRGIEERTLAETERERLVSQLRLALAEVRTLSGLLPICASCKRIRGDGGWWEIESYISEHSGAEFSHGLCPDCAQRLYPAVFDSVEQGSL